jgi:hypothetical protein
MAIIVDGMKCAICGQSIRTKGPLFATWGVFFPPEHPLYRFCDAPLHWECYATWPQRQEFARGYLEMRAEGDRHNPYWGTAFRSDRVLVTVNPEPPGSVQVVLAETGSRLFVALDEWEHWLADLMGAVEGLHPLEQAALREVWPELRATLPTAEAIVGRVDWAPKYAQREARELALRRAKEERRRRVRVQNMECRRLLQQGPVCPHCTASDGIRFVDRSPQEKSFFICNHCARSFTPPSDNHP